MDIESNYLDRYRELIRKILDLLGSIGEMSVDGIYINLPSYDRGLIISIVDRLWREGYLNRVADRSGVRYRLTVKGLRLFKEVRDDG